MLTYISVKGGSLNFHPFLLLEIGMSVIAVHVADRDEFMEKKIPGSFWVSQPDSDGEQYFWYFCPCGYGAKGPLVVGNGFKPSKADASDGTSAWNGSLSAPDLKPSVHHVGHWHGYLTNGEWITC